MFSVVVNSKEQKENFGEKVKGDRKQTMQSTDCFLL